MLLSLCIFIQSVLIKFHTNSSWTGPKDVQIGSNLSIVVKALLIFYHNFCFVVLPGKDKKYSVIFSCNIIDINSYLSNFSAIPNSKSFTQSACSPLVLPYQNSNVGGKYKREFIIGKRQDCV